MTAIVRSDVLDKVDIRLREIGVQGISVTKVKGYGEYADFYSPDWMVPHARIEIFTMAKRAEDVAGAIMDAPHLGMSGDGIVAILPVEKLYRIRTRSTAEADEL